MKTIVNVPVYEKESYIKQLNKLNKKAEKYGFEPITYTIGEMIQEKHSVPVVDFDGTVDHNDTIEMIRNVYPFEIEFETIKIGNYQFIGQIENRFELSGKKGFSLFNGREEIAQMFEDVSPKRCDHCNTKHDRKFQIVLKSIDDNKYIVVGKSCLKDYIGIEPKQYFDWESSLDKAINKDYSSCGFECGYDINKAFKVASVEIQAEGFKPSSFGKQSTMFSILSQLSKI